jgi:hypothetical protein
MGYLKEKLLSGIGKDENFNTNTKPTKPTQKTNTTELRLQKVKPKQELTAQQEDFLLEQAREDYYEKKYKDKE